MLVTYHTPQTESHCADGKSDYVKSFLSGEGLCAADLVHAALKHPGADPGRSVKLHNDRWRSEQLLKIDLIFSCFQQIYHRLKPPVIEDVDSSGFHYCVSHNLGSAAVHLNH